MNVSFQKNPASYAAQKAKLNAPLKNGAGLIYKPMPAINLTQSTEAQLKTSNPAIRLLKAVSKIFTK